MRRAATAVLCALAGLMGPAGGFASDQPDRDILDAWYDEPTTRYAHGVLGDAVEWGALVLRIDTCPGCALLKTRNATIRLPETRVFEDLAPRVVDLDRDGRNEVLVIESHQRKGARIAVYGPEGLRAHGPYIGTRYRWLAPIGAMDFDGDGTVEIAYIDRPHLAKRLTLLRYAEGQMQVAATLDGFTNHRIGEDFISGGVRTCAGHPEMIVASADWARVVAVRYDGDGFQTQDLGRFSGPDSFARALRCD